MVFRAGREIEETVMNAPTVMWLTREQLNTLSGVFAELEESNRVGMPGMVIAQVEINGRVRVGFISQKPAHDVQKAMGTEVGGLLYDEEQIERMLAQAVSTSGMWSFPNAITNAGACQSLTVQGRKLRRQILRARFLRRNAKGHE